MRSLAVFAVIFASLPFIFRLPHLGVYLFSWISYMNPHRLTFGAAFGFPFAMLVGGSTIVAWILSREPKRIPMHPITVMLTLLLVWITITTLTAQFRDDAVEIWNQTSKIILFNGFITLALIHNRQRLQILIWVIVGSLGFFGVKGGFFTLVSGGNYHVFGPDRSFIADNNALGLALLMIVPLMRYLQLNADKRRLRNAMLCAMGLTLVAILGTQSRGALVGLIIMLFALFIKSRRRLLGSVAIGMIVGMGINFMPDQWSDRMATILSFSEESSATSRMEAWAYATGVAVDNPILGGGFTVVQNAGPRSSHSIYFQVLGEHSFIGLFLFLALGFTAAFTGFAVSRRVKGHPELTWARDLAGMLQVSLAAYAASGAFLNLAYFDLYYHIVAIMAATSIIARKAVAELEAEAKAPPTLGPTLIPAPMMPGYGPHPQPG